MAREALIPGAPPAKEKLIPTQGADGVWRLTEVRHRAINGAYPRSSGTGSTQAECLEDFWEHYEVNRMKGSIRRKRRTPRPETRKFEPTDKMSAVFANFRDRQKARLEKGEIKQRTVDNYLSAIYPIEGRRAKEDAVKLESELGAFTIAELGRPSELVGYIEDIADFAPGMALLHHVILAACFKTLTLQGLYQVSPMRGVPRPGQRGGGQRALNAAERAEFVGLLADSEAVPRGHDYLLPYALALMGTGIRAGEGLALRWADIPDLDDDTVGRATAHVCGTIVRLPGRKPFRQDSRKSGNPYYVTLPQWLTDVLKAWKRECAPTDEAALVFALRGGPIAVGSAMYARDCALFDSPLEWMTWGNLRDTVATEVVGKTGDSRRASAQLGHSEGSSVATRHYIDRDGYVHAAVDNSEALEGLYPQNVGNLTVLARFPQSA